MKKLIILLTLFSIQIVLAQWSSDPDQNLRVTTRGLLPEIISDGNGGAFIAYNDMPLLGIHIHLQRLDKYGYQKFPGNGIMIADSSHYQAQRYFLVNDNEGGVIIAFDDSYLKDDKGYTRASAQRIDSTGKKLWGKNGITVAPQENSRSLDLVSACSDGQGGCYIFWGVYHDQQHIDLMAQHLDSQGNFMWDSSGVLITDHFLSFESAQPCLTINDEDGNVIVLYYDSPYNTLGAKLQKIDFDGYFLWENGVVAYSSGWATIKKDGYGGVIIAHSYRFSYDYDFGWHYNIAVQHVDCNGNTLWGDEGIIITGLADDQVFNPQLVVNENGASYTVWQDSRNGTSGVYAQKLDQNGEPQWPDDGIPVSSSNSIKSIHWDIVPDSDSGIVVIWIDSRDDTRSLRAQRIDNNSNYLWPNDMTITKRLDRDTQVVSDGNGGAIICWYETAPDIGIYAQQISYDGSLGKVIETFVPDYNHEIAPRSIELEQNFPNPFNAATTITYYIDNSSHVSINIYDVTGKKVVNLLNKKLNKGQHRIVWNGKNQKGGDLASGVYFIQLKTDNFSKTKKALLIR